MYTRCKPACAVLPESVGGCVLHSMKVDSGTSKDSGAGQRRPAPAARAPMGRPAAGVPADCCSQSQSAVIEKEATPISLQAQSAPCLSVPAWRRACRRLCRRRHSHRGTKSLSGLKMPIAGARILRCSLKRKIAASGQPAGRPAAAALRPLGMPPGVGPHQAPPQLERKARASPCQMQKGKHVTTAAGAVSALPVSSTLSARMPPPLPPPPQPPWHKVTVRPKNAYCRCKNTALFTQEENCRQWAAGRPACRRRSQTARHAARHGPSSGAPSARNTAAVRASPCQMQKGTQVRIAAGTVSALPSTQSQAGCSNASAAATLEPLPSAAWCC